MGSACELVGHLRLPSKSIVSDVCANVKPFRKILFLLLVSGAVYNTLARLNDEGRIMVDVDKLSSLEKDLVLRVLTHYMDMHLRGIFMETLPVAYMKMYNMKDVTCDVGGIKVSASFKD